MPNLWHVCIRYIWIAISTALLLKQRIIQYNVILYSYGLVLSERGCPTYAVQSDICKVVPKLFVFGTKSLGSIRMNMYKSKTGVEKKKSTSDNNCKQVAAISFCDVE